MAYKYTFQSAIIQVAPDGSLMSSVAFQIRDDATVGKLGQGVEDNASLPLTFPVTAAGLRTQAISAITAKYPGATPDS